MSTVYRIEGLLFAAYFPDEESFFQDDSWETEPIEAELIKFRRSDASGITRYKVCLQTEQERTWHWVKFSCPSSLGAEQEIVLESCKPVKIPAGKRLEIIFELQEDIQACPVKVWLFKKKMISHGKAVRGFYLGMILACIAAAVGLFLK